ncbi:hypothetical protein [Raoultella ornithinolytica]|uniref:hypothetical protein n=1 Tax=Raoultella ornithinolytica TaxID=54291 RepID=UPI001F4156DF|nr:hypothetical protein [Raoultella ornithinolytica]MCE9801727.1 hypothetical protein [Raoultella ornithinolytica]MCE9810574.1 hypothetical protein [Raoultella ornithinolytica]MCE9866276.1 hypothetical protein [Raoultella ornithinolytica]
MKTAKIDFGVESAETIFKAIIDGVTTQTALYGFMNRVGTNKRSTKKALEMLREHKLRLKRNACAARTIRTILKPYSAELAKERDVLDIIQPVLTAWRLFYAKQGIGLMNDQVLILKMVEAASELEKLTGQPVPDMVTEG